MQFAAPLTELYRHLRLRQSALVRALAALVILESPSTEPAAVDRLARWLAREWRSRGARVRLLRPRRSGAILRAEVFLGRGRPRGQLLILGHLDTVYGLGTLAGMPFRVRGGRAYGPGTVDMKSGLVQALFAVEALQALKLTPPAKLVFLFTSDEEVGSRAGRPVVEREARRSRAVLVLEPASGRRGALKTARKGVGEFELVVEGRAAHAGIEPEKGVNAIEELAAQLLRIKQLARPRRGLTLNANVIEGGTRTNVVAERARALVDVRVSRRADGRLIERRVHSLRPVNPRARLRVSGGLNRPPLERTAKVVRLFRHAHRLAQALRIRLEESSTGGGSDGNFTAALGVPTLDGLGGVGGGAHSPGEFVVLRRMPERAALLAGLLLTL
ncbi:MAG: M20 family metallopeptidase [Acidobacteria bacterium]|nr:M20 family metallopeptidase [Acidobacteriota bacterium]